MSALSIGGGGLVRTVAQNPGTIPIDRKLKQRVLKVQRQCLSRSWSNTYIFGGTALASS